MQLDPAGLAPRDAYQLLISVIVPRPIAFVSTVDVEGRTNLAPFSFWNGVTSHPPIVMVAVGRRKGIAKDTGRNIAATGEFVVNVVDEALAEAMNLASGDYPPGVSEFDVTGLTPAPCGKVRAPRVEESPVSLECTLERIIPVGPPETGSDLVLGRVVLYHVRDDLYVDGRVDPARLHPVGRLGASGYCRVRDLFQMVRPKV
jgi:flavin reductase (DIM6/NTAB) family NADH-FMN oxidoreductase RutF